MYFYKGGQELKGSMWNSHEDDERDFPPSDIAALSMCILFYSGVALCALHHESRLLGWKTGGGWCNGL